MKRLLLALVLLPAGVAAVMAYTTINREREFRQLLFQGDAALEADQTFAAIEAFSGAITLKDDSMLAYVKRGETYRRRGDLTSALRDLRTAVRLDPTATRPLELVGDLHYALGGYRRAAERYAEYVRLDDRSPRVLYKLALAHFRDGRPAAAVEPLQGAVALDERFAEAAYLLGLCLHEDGRHDEARETLERAVLLSPAFVPAREALVELYRSGEATAPEIEQLEALAALDPRPERHMLLGLAYARGGRTEAAVLTLGNAAERYPDQPQLYVALGRVWLEAAERRGDRVALSKALEALQGSATGAGATSEAMALLGRALFLAGDDELAERMLRQASATFPVDPSAFRYLADAAQRLGHLADARDALIRDQRLAGDEGTSVDRVAEATRIGDLSLRLNEPAVAATWFRRAVEATPNPDGLLLARLADAAWKAGDLSAAKAAIERGLAQAPNHPVLLNLQRRMR